MVRLAHDEPSTPIKYREGTISTPFRKIFAIICLSPVFRVTNACATANINANSFGWNQYSHGGFKGGSEAMPVTLPGMPSFTPFETPLFTIWKWFDRMELMKAYPRGVE
jgi:hypothetical protein